MKFSNLLVIALLVLPILAVGQAKKSPYIGYEYKGVVPSATLPNGVKHFGGGLIGKIDADPVHGISQVEKGRTKMLWLEVSTGQDAGGVSGWRVKDVLVFPALTRSDYIFFAGDPAILCRQRGTEIVNLVGVGRIARREAIFRPSKLWVANLRTEKFEPMSLAGVKCEYSEP
jgi:hypothetical protein